MLTENNYFITLHNVTGKIWEIKLAQKAEGIKNFKILTSSVRVYIYIYIYTFNKNFFAVWQAIPLNKISAINSKPRNTNFMALFPLISHLFTVCSIVPNKNSYSSTPHDHRNFHLDFGPARFYLHRFLLTETRAKRVRTSVKKSALSRRVSPLITLAKDNSARREEVRSFSMECPRENSIGRCTDCGEMINSPLLLSLMSHVVNETLEIVRKSTDPLGVRDNQPQEEKSQVHQIMTLTRGFRNVIGNENRI